MPPGPVLVTGAAGFVGQHLLRALTTASPVVGWHRPGTSHPEMPGVTWVAVELLDRAAVAAALAAAAPEAIYHLAGVAHVGDSWAHAEETFAGNVVGTSHLFDAMQTLGLACRVLVTGSAAIYQPSADALTEASPIAPNTPYGTSKLAQEMVALAAWRDHGIPALVTRSFNHIGPGQSPAFAASGFAQQLARIEAGLAPPVLAVGNLEARRDISDVRDTVRAYVALMASGRAGHSYNVCVPAAPSRFTRCSTASWRACRCQSPWPPIPRACVRPTRQWCSAVTPSSRPTRAGRRCSRSMTRSMGCWGFGAARFAPAAARPSSAHLASRGT